MNRTKKRLKVIPCILFILLSGCVSPGNESNETVPGSESPLPEVIQVTATSTPTQIASPTPSETPFPLSDEDAAAVLLNLYETNGDCELPCWWGITVGETSFASAMDLLLSIGRIYETYTYRTEQVLHIAIDVPQDFPDFSSAWVYLYSPSNPSDLNYGIVTGLSVDDTFSKPYSDYVLADYLRLFGEPDQVYISFSIPFVFFNLFYVDEAITISNQNIKNEYQEDFKFLACPQSQLENTWHWSVWNPDTIQLEDMVTGAQSGPFYSPFEKHTEITIHEFYEIYLDPDTSYCIEGGIDIESEN